MTQVPSQERVLTKKEKRMERRRAFLSKLEPTSALCLDGPKSKSALKRQKKQARLLSMAELKNVVGASLMTQPGASIFSKPAEDDMQVEVFDIPETTTTTAAVETQVEPPVPNHTSKTRVTSQKGRKWTLKKELAQMQQVLKHAQFRTNPLLTLKTHIENTAASIE